MLLPPFAFKVHTAFSRVCQAVEGWLGLEGLLPPAVIRNAYLHYEALCQHNYDYFCVICGHHPPFLVTDADRKGMFDLSGNNDTLINICNKQSTKYQ